MFWLRQLLQVFLIDARQLFQLQMLLKGDHPSAEALVRAYDDG